jgi:hypothetical protein
VRALTITPNPERNPIDEFGLIYFCIALSVQMAYLLGAKKLRKDP